MHLQRLLHSLCVLFVFLLVYYANSAETLSGSFIGDQIELAFTRANRHALHNHLSDLNPASPILENTNGMFTLCHN